MDGPGFDELAKAMRSAATRRQAAGGLLGLGLAALTGRTLTDAKAKRHGKHAGKGKGARDASGPGGKGGNSACAKFCAQVFGADTPAAGQCTSDAAHGKGLCHQCGAKVSNACCVPQNGVCSDYASAQCCTGQDTCGGGGTAGVCGHCVPDSPATTCNGRCDFFKNNCGEAVNCTQYCAGCCADATCLPGTGNDICGKNGAVCANCASPAVCHGQTCCTPDCAGKCGGADNGCGGKCPGDAGSCPSECQTCGVDGQTCQNVSDGIPCGGTGSGLRCCNGVCPSPTCLPTGTCCGGDCGQCCGTSGPAGDQCPGSDSPLCRASGANGACARDTDCAALFFANQICTCGRCCIVAGGQCSVDGNCCSKQCQANGTCA